MKQRVAIAIVGDEGSGKSSLVSCILLGDFPKDPAKLIPSAHISPHATQYHVPITINDTTVEDSYNVFEDPEHNTYEAMASADVICITYDLSIDNSDSRLEEYWIPNIEDHFPGTPYVLVGTKLDFFDDPEDLPEESRYPRVKACRHAFFCSSLEMVNVCELFSDAVSVSVNPRTPLCAEGGKRLSKSMILALSRIFLIVDLDGDRLLSEDEYIYYREVVKGETPDRESVAKAFSDVEAWSSEGLDVTENGERRMTKAGLFYLFHVLLENEELEEIWATLRAFGYGNDLRLLESYLLPPEIVAEAKHDVVCELSPEGERFFEQLFERFDRDHDSALNEKELKSLFRYSSPPRHPFERTHFPKNSTLTDPSGNVSLDGWLAEWKMMTYQHYDVTTRYLASLGFVDDDLDMAIHFKDRCQGKKHDPQEEDARTVFQCYVVGAPGVGKTSLLNGHIGLPYSKEHVPTMLPRSVVAPISLRPPYHLILKEFGADESVKCGGLTDVNLRTCDVLCMMYDVTNPYSFEYLTRVQQQLHEWDVPVPTVYCANKGEGDTVTQRFESAEHAMSPTDFCKKFGIQAPLEISMKSRALSDTPEDVYNDLLNAALNPSPYMSALYSDSERSSGMMKIVFIGAGAIIFAGGVYFLGRWAMSRLLKK